MAKLDLTAIDKIESSKRGDSIGASSTADKAKRLVPEGSFIRNGKQENRGNSSNKKERTGSRRKGK